MNLAVPIMQVVWGTPTVAQNGKHKKPTHPTHNSHKAHTTAHSGVLIGEAPSGGCAPHHRQFGHSSELGVSSSQGLEVDGVNLD